MFQTLDEILRENPVALLFVILGIGYLIGKPRVRGFELGPVTGVLFAGLVFGHYGFELSPRTQAFGFAMFIFSVGFQAGPGFFVALRRDGARYFVLALVVGATGFVLAAILAGAFELPTGTSAGLLAGAMTTTPTLAAAQDALQSGVVSMPDGLTVDRAVRNVTTTYAITYLFGLIGLILIIRVLPRLLRIDLPAEAEKIGQRPVTVDPSERISIRAYRVEGEEVCGIPLAVLKERSPGKAAPIKLRRDGQLVEITDETEFRIGDEVAVAGHLERFVRDSRRWGPEITDPELLDMETDHGKIVVNRRDAVGISLGRLGVTDNYACFLTGIRRVQTELPLEPSVELHRGDVLEVTGPHANIESLGTRLGHLERDHVETDLLTLAFGIALGIVIGTFSVTVAGVSVGLGTAGGLLTTGLVIGYLRSIRPTFGRIPQAVRWTFMELGLQMFMAGVGVSAGAGIVETLGDVGPRLVLCGIAVTVGPVVTGWVVGRYVLGFNPAVLLGAVTGAMTSGAALSVVNSAAKSTVPALGYTGAYAFANVILTIAGTLIVRL